MERLCNVKGMEALTIKIIFRDTRKEGATPSRRHLAVYMESGLPNRVDYTKQVIVSEVKAICSNKKAKRGKKYNVSVSTCR